MLPCVERTPGSPAPRDRRLTQPPGKQCFTAATPSPTATAEAWLASFTTALAGGDPQAVVALFGPECFWRDLVAFTWNLRTEEGPEAIAAMLAARLEDVMARALMA